MVTPEITKQEGPRTQRYRLFAQFFTWLNFLHADDDADDGDNLVITIDFFSVKKVELIIIIKLVTYV